MTVLCILSLSLGASCQCGIQVILGWMFLQTPHWTLAGSMVLSTLSRNSCAAPLQACLIPLASFVSPESSPRNVLLLRLLSGLRYILELTSVFDIQGMNQRTACLHWLEGGVWDQRWWCPSTLSHPSVSKCFSSSPVLSHHGGKRYGWSLPFLSSNTVYNLSKLGYFEGRNIKQLLYFAVDSVLETSTLKLWVNKLKGKFLQSPQSRKVPFPLGQVLCREKGKHLWKRAELCQVWQVFVRLPVEEPL